MATKVKMTYNGKGGVATSVTKREGRVTKFTVWYPGQAGSTQRVEVPR